MVPNLEYVVQAVRDSKTWDFTTKEGLCEYSNACVHAMFQVNDQFGHLRKAEAQNHCTDPAGRFTAVDVTFYKLTGQVVDFISSAGYGVPPPPNTVTWQPGPEGEYTDAFWIQPIPNDGGEVPLPPDPEVPQDVRDQLNRMEQDIIQIKLFMSNMNDQMALGFGEVNKIRADQNPAYSGTMVRTGDNLELKPVK